MHWMLWTCISLLFLFCVIVYFVRRKERLEQMEKEEKWRESLPEEEWEVSDPWTSEPWKEGE